MIYFKYDPKEHILVATPFDEIQKLHEEKNKRNRELMAKANLQREELTQTEEGKLLFPTSFNNLIDFLGTIVLPTVYAEAESKDSHIIVKHIDCLNISCPVCEKGKIICASCGRSNEDLQLPCTHDRCTIIW